VEDRERRRSRRKPIELRLEIDEVFKQDDMVIKNLGAQITVFDISRDGIGFMSDASIPVGYYFKALINLGENDFFRAVIQIVRSSIDITGQNIYGAQFVGLAPFLAAKVDKYEKK
jgi:hypothetical protein